ncbi:unnamed protein product [[Candida] boidinii]|uniref:Calcium-binding protein NCS-1 n=1 Tax=Candida boidinii TaxID=5477 RepID=A0A9W6WE02_CANBO|nr:hypothetical protein BVG19_g5428 [[Candida] boidinii]OWB51689.1 hypothetical protein B5S27_g3255 [[Candida] boidinii]OWB69649.1 hypothetical protein B5S30_g5072 [[Candida] boidinii]OWB83786.1 hypothetical protein B5S33_g2419 [[Candida] boidinii]GME67584.1 unnamed protein product [[Candida] boidinii]
MGKAASKLSREDINDLKKYTYFHSRELQQWYKGFQRDCPSGHLTKDDFIRIHKQFFPFGDPTEFSSYAFEAFDYNNNGYINFKEFIMSLSITSRGTLEEKLKWSFRIYDRDKDGYISYDDMLTVVRAIYKMIGLMAELNSDEKTPELRVEKIFESLDKDKDRMITLDEFTSGNKMDPAIVGALSLYSDLV